MLKLSTTTAIAVIHCCGAFLIMENYYWETELPLSTNEDHDSHGTIHEPEIKELMAEGKEKEAQELMRHSQMHEYLRSLSLQQKCPTPRPIHI